MNKKESELVREYSSHIIMYVSKLVSLADKNDSDEIRKAFLKVSNVENLSSNKEEDDLMRFNKGIRKRKDGRYDWRKTINGVQHYLINSNLKTLVKEVQEYKRKISKNKATKPTATFKLIDLCREYYKRYIEGKRAGDKNYSSIINKYLSSLTRKIGDYTKDDLVDFINSIESKKQAKLCYYLLRYVYNDAEDKKLIRTNIMAKISPPEVKAEKGNWFNIEEQKLIYENRHMSPIGNEIEFYLLVGCRLREAFECVPDFDRNTIFVSRSKRDGSSGYVKLSEIYSAELKKCWSNMFKLRPDYYTREFVKLLEKLKIKRQAHEKPMHRLRHTFATNIYYLGVNDKERSYLLGHKTTKMTNDVYTDFDPNVRKQDVIDIYGDKYPNF